MMTIINIDGCWGGIKDAEILEITDEAYNRLCDGMEIEHLPSSHVQKCTYVSDLYEEKLP